MKQKKAEPQSLSEIILRNSQWENAVKKIIDNDIMNYYVDESYNPESVNSAKNMTEKRNRARKKGNF